MERTDKRQIDANLIRAYLEKWETVFGKEAITVRINPIRTLQHPAFNGVKRLRVASKWAPGALP